MAKNPDIRHLRVDKSSMSSLLAAAKRIDELRQWHAANAQFKVATAKLTDETCHSRFELVEFARENGNERNLVGRVVSIFAMCRFTRLTRGKREHREDPRIIADNMRRGFEPLVISDLNTRPLEMKGIGLGGLTLLVEFLQARGYEVPKWVEREYREKGA